MAVNVGQRYETPDEEVWEVKQINMVQLENSDGFIMYQMETDLQDPIQWNKIPSRPRIVEQWAFITNQDRMFHTGLWMSAEAAVTAAEALGVAYSLIRIDPTGDLWLVMPNGRTEPL